MNIDRPQCIICTVLLLSWGDFPTCVWGNKMTPTPAAVVLKSRSRTYESESVEFATQTLSQQQPEPEQFRVRLRLSAQDRPGAESRRLEREQHTSA